MLFSLLPMNIFAMENPPVTTELPASGDNTEATAEDYSDRTAEELFDIYTEMKEAGDEDVLRTFLDALTEVQREELDALIEAAENDAEETPDPAGLAAALAAPARNSLMTAKALLPQEPAEEPQPEEPAEETEQEQPAEEPEPEEPAEEPEEEAEPEQPVEQPAEEPQPEEPAEEPAEEAEPEESAEEPEPEEPAEEPVEEAEPEEDSYIYI